MKKYFLCLLVIGAPLVFPPHAHAEVVVNEVMYNLDDTSGPDAGREWLELYNDGPSPMTIIGGVSGTSSWRIYQISSSGTESNHTLSATA